MSDVQIHTTRLDPTANEPLMAIAKAGAAAFGYTAELRLDGQLAQLLRLRVAQINNCTSSSVRSMARRPKPTRSGKLGCAPIPTPRATQSATVRSITRGSPP
jgi:hypothetical protein